MPRYTPSWTSMLKIVDVEVTVKSHLQNKLNISNVFQT